MSDEANTAPNKTPDDWDDWIGKRNKLRSFIRNENITPDIVVWVLEQIFPASEELTMCCGKKGGVLLVKHIPACDDPIHS